MGFYSDSNVKALTDALRSHREMVESLERLIDAQNDKIESLELELKELKK